MIAKPYAKKSDNLRNIISESILFIVSVLIFALIEEENRGVELAVIIIVIAGFFLNTLSLILEPITMIILFGKVLRNQSPNFSVEKDNMVLKGLLNHNLIKIGIVCYRKPRTKIYAVYLMRIS